VNVPSRVHGFLSGRGWPFRQAALALLAGALTAHGEPGVGLAPLFLVGLVAFAFLTARARSSLAAGSIGAFYGAAMFAVIMISSLDWGWIVPIALTLVGVALYGLPLALWSHWASRRIHGTVLFVATAAAWSLCMDVGDLVGFPSKCEALSAVAFAPVLMGGCRLFGSNVACGILMAGAVGCGTALARLSTRDLREMARALTPLGASLALLLAASGLARMSAPSASASVTVGVPQLNVPSDYFIQRQAVPERTDQLEERFSQQLRELGDVDLLALTETYDGTFPLQVPRLRERFRNYAKLQQQGLLLTSYLVGKAGGGLNAVGGIDANGALVGVHRKVNLAPFGEVELERGAGFHALPVLPNVRVGALICQEALLAEGSRALTRDGANLLVTTTSDISFGSGILGFGHLAAARLRAIEVGRAMVWASNGGPSGAISRWGDFRAAAPFREPAAAKMSVELFQDTAPFLRVSWLWPPLCAGLLLFFLLRSRARAALQPSTQRRLSTARGALELGLALALAAIATVASPATVEAMSGDGARARQAVLELVGRAGSDLGPTTLARFHTDAEHSAQGALAFYLDYYGDRRLPSSVELTAANPTLRDLSRELTVTEDFPTREVVLNFKALPRASALVRTKAGEFGVLTSNSLNVVGLFLPTQSRQTQLTYAQARLLLEPTALLPENDPSLD
jgi:apolipoprotein N-acyltransferase